MPIKVILFQLNFGTCLFKLLFQALSVSLGKTFFDGAGSVVYQFLSFFQAETGQFLHELNDCKLACTGSFKNNVECALLFSGFACSGGTSCYCYCGSGGLDAIFILQDLNNLLTSQ